MRTDLACSTECIAATCGSSQDYKTNPAKRVANKSPLPGNIASAQWLKRSNVLDVLEKRLPLDYADSQDQLVDVDCNSCEVIIDETSQQVYEKGAVPEVPITQRQAEPTSTGGTGQARTGQTAGTVPVETGAPHHRTYARHQDFHKQSMGSKKLL
jgi:hypothetical protein